MTGQGAEECHLPTVRPAGEDGVGPGRNDRGGRVAGEGGETTPGWRWAVVGGGALVPGHGAPSWAWRPRVE